MKASGNSKIVLFLSKYWPLAFTLVLALVVADLLVLYLRPYLLITPIKLGQATKPRIFVSPKAGDYQIVVSKNIFSPDGIIPDTLAALRAKEKNAEVQADEVKDDAPVPSTLPINLIGTIVHSSNTKSIANIEIKSKNITLAVRVGNTIDNLARLESVERGKIIIRNSNNNRLEYLELKDLNKIAFNSKQKVSEVATTEEIKQVAPNKFEIKRADVLKYTSDLSNILQQASTIPMRGPGGEIIGFRLVNIQPDSIYTQLGLQVGDVIKGVNGEPIDSPAKALELYNALKGSNDIKINMERSGRDQDMEYQIK